MIRRVDALHLLHGSEGHDDLDHGVVVGPDGGSFEALKLEEQISRVDATRRSRDRRLTTRFERSPRSIEVHRCSQRMKEMKFSYNFESGERARDDGLA